jgi:G6PDH family F420-dependent oxidoreductase
MVELGYALSSEEHAPNDLVKHAQMAEDAGFTFALISDHFHPWVDAQGHSPFIWSVLGGIAHATKTIRFGTGVTCPTIRYHPAIIAQAAATVAAMMPGRFFLGVGSGENLNEHITGEKWPAAQIRLEMLEEAIDMIRILWQGSLQSYYGLYYTLENARLYTLPDQPIPLYVAAMGEKAATLAGEMGDGFINTEPDKEVVQAFEEAGGKGKPRIGQMTVCWAKDERKAIETAMKYWRFAGLQGPLSQELPLPSHFEKASETVREKDLVESVICGPDPSKYLEKIKKYADAGFDHVYLHQVGPDQEGFFHFFERELQPGFQRQHA